jgi:hypothetical protein
MKNRGRNSLRLGAANFVEKQDELFWPGNSLYPAVVPLKPVTPSTALNVVNYFVRQNNGVSASISANIAAKTGNLIIIQAAYADNSESTAWTITNTGSAITWTKKIETNTTSNCKVVVWTGVAGAVPPQSITVTSTAGTGLNGAKVLNIDVAQNAGTDIVNIFSGTLATDVSQAVTPTTSNSAVRLFAADWAATNSFTAGNANTLLTNNVTIAGELSAAALRTIPDPLTSNSAVTIAELDTAGTIAWAAFEIPLATVAGNTGSIVSGLINDRSSLAGVQSASGTIVSRLNNDLSSLTGSQPAIVSIVSKLKDDLSSLAGSQSTVGTISSTLISDRSSLTGVQAASGSIASNLIADSSSLVGSQSGAVSGTITSKLVDDRSSLIGVQTATVAISSLLKSDSSSLVGSQSGAVSGVVSSSLINDRSSLTGIQSATVTIVSRLNNDLSSLIGVQSSPVTGFVASILNDDSSVVIGTSGVQPITVVKPKGAGKKSGKKALTYAERKKIDEQVFDALYGLTEDLAEKADISKDFITKEFIDDIVKTKVDNISIDDFYLPSTIIDQSFYEETAKIKTELILKKLQKAQEEDDEQALLLLL